MRNLIGFVALSSVVAIGAAHASSGSRVNSSFGGGDAAISGVPPSYPRISSVGGDRSVEYKSGYLSRLALLRHRARKMAAANGGSLSPDQVDLLQVRLEQINARYPNPLRVRYGD